MGLAQRTQTGDRPDLAMLETNPVLGYIGELIFPTVPVAEKTGTVYFRDAVTADAAGQTGRSASAAPTETVLSAASTTYTAAEVIKRYVVSEDEVKNYGGVEQADILGGKASKRSVQRAIEEAIADAVLLTDGPTTVDILASLIGAVETGLEAIRRYPGQSAFVCSSTIFHRIMKYTEITNRFSLAGAVIQGADAMEVINRRPNALKMALSSILSVDHVLVGDDDQWYDSDAGKQDRAALVKLPDREAFSHNMDPVFGKNFVYMPDGQQQFEIVSHFDYDDLTNKYDAKSWYNLVTFNPEACYRLQGLDASNTVTTSTTTTA